MDSFLWGYLKQQVYATPPPTMQDLQRRITDACANMTPAMLHRVQREVQAKIQMCIVADGEKFEHRKQRLHLQGGCRGQISQIRTRSDYKITTYDTLITKTSEFFYIQLYSVSIKDETNVVQLEYFPFRAGENRCHTTKQ
ncbi:hypothetical protein AVEN_302-1 [Araneus ventricosus]|uniref:Uncharacterized protein n=1 Tax=Araneus ventricosus TaxID=182803 RepID=A0A4Y2I3Q8_ARAVE|nr:hypothetical protein AVEN_302-1 [Araneus ventricosus]